MARAKREVNKEEVDEIIYLKLEELGGRKHKLSANNLAKFSKKIAKNEEYTRSDGSLYNYYGYDFWAGDYKGVDYYGKTRLAEIKNSVDVIVAGKEFIPEVQDIIVLVDKYYKQPELLTKRLCNIFESDKQKITKLTDKINNLEEENKKLKEHLDDFKRGFATVFLNSNSTENSLKDVLSISREKDGYISDELQNMFKEDFKEFMDSTKGNTAKEEFEQREETNTVIDNTILARRRNRLKR